MLIKSLHNNHCLTLATAAQLILNLNKYFNNNSSSSSNKKNSNKKAETLTYLVFKSLAV